MPCSDPIQSHSDKRAQVTANAIVIFDKKMGVQTEEKISRITGAYSFYGDMCDYLTAHLCAKIRALSPEDMERVVYDAHDRDSRKLADWWDDHKKYDDEREQH